MSWKPLIRIEADGGWCANPWRFATRDEAIAATRWVADQWLAVIDWRVSRSTDPATHRMANGVPEKISLPSP
jgi:hypothetical protein